MPWSRAADFIKEATAVQKLPNGYPYLLIPVHTKENQATHYPTKAEDFYLNLGSYTEVAPNHNHNPSPSPNPSASFHTPSLSHSHFFCKKGTSAAEACREAPLKNRSTAFNFSYIGPAE